MARLSRYLLPEYPYYIIHLQNGMYNSKTSRPCPCTAHYLLFERLPKPEYITPYNRAISQGEGHEWTS